MLGALRRLDGIFKEYQNKGLFEPPTWNGLERALLATNPVIIGSVRVVPKEEHEADETLSTLLEQPSFQALALINLCREIHPSQFPDLGVIEPLLRTDLIERTGSGNDRKDFERYDQALKKVSLSCDNMN